jgi:hypothetical protein
MKGLIVHMRAFVWDFEGFQRVPKFPNGVPQRITSTPPAKDNPQATTSIFIRGSNYLSMLPFPIPFDV